MSDSLHPLDAEWSQAVELLKAGEVGGALFRFRRLAKEGVEQAYAEIGHIYELGGKGVPRDFDEARKWYETAVDRSSDVDAHYCLGRLFVRSDYPGQDYEKALHHFMRSKDLWHSSTYFALGCIYERSEPPLFDRKVAMAYYYEAASKGHATAFNRLARLQIKEGSVLKGSLNWIKSMVRIARIVFRDPDDSRLYIQ